MARAVPESLRLPALARLWTLVRDRLDRHGGDRRGTVACPDLDPEAALALGSLLGHRPTRRIDLAELEHALLARGVGDDLGDALTRLGHPPSERARVRRERRARKAAARAALDRAVDGWPEPWAADWRDAVVRIGLVSTLETDAVTARVDQVRRLLDRLDALDPPGASRTELAATLCGNSHALDPGTPLAALVTQALRLRIGPFEGRALWERAGVLFDKVSAPALVWALPVLGDSPLATQIRMATTAALPLHLSLVALQRFPVEVARGTPVLVVENPRLVEAAAERALDACVIATNGNPSTAVATLLEQLRFAGATLRCHADFDAPGIGICRRLHASGCRPWMMGERDYLAAVRSAGEHGARPLTDDRSCGPTPWAPALEGAFERSGVIVHEELVLDEVLAGFAGSETSGPC